MAHATLILCDRWGALRRLLGRHRGPCRFLRLSWSPESLRIARKLRAMPGATELERGPLLDEQAERFRRAYSGMIAELNTQHHDADWWLMPWTTKNPLSTDLCANAAYAQLLSRLASPSQPPLIVVTDSVELAGQMTSWGRSTGIRVRARVRGASPWKRMAKRWTPAAILWAWAAAGLTWGLSRRLRPSRADARPCWVMTTTVPQSSPGPGAFRDAYFAPLATHLARTGRRAMTVAIVLAKPIRTVWALRRPHTEPPVMPVEGCLSVRDLLGCGWRSLLRWAAPPRLRRPALLDGLDISPLVHEAIMESSRSSSFVKHLRVRVAAKRLARTIQVAQWFYPFENRAVEKALLLGVRAVSPATQMVGWQNSALTPSHVNFFLGPREARITPLPDRLLTTGHASQAWLEQEGHYPTNLLEVGCTLRQGSSLERPVRARPTCLSRVLVALASSVEEYTETLLVVTQAFRQKGLSAREVRLRRHPEFPIRPVARVMPEVWREPYQFSTGSLEDDLAWAHVVLYASSTVSLEAVAQGVPVIHLDLGGILNTDPLFQHANGLRWVAATPSALRESLRTIETLPAVEFERRQHSSREYLRSYWLPATRARLEGLLGTPAVAPEAAEAVAREPSRVRVGIGA